LSPFRDIEAVPDLEHYFPVIHGFDARVARIMRAVPGLSARANFRLLSILAILEMSMLKKLVPAVLGALLAASPVLAVTTAAAAPQAAASDTGSMKSDSMKSHHKASKHKKASHHAMKKQKHWKKTKKMKKAKKAKKAPTA
jgi:hypothetical protein